ncbi:multidrug effflux MFS transporter [Salidesulfovibrio onnuriiensis]|uniref:multidrug effflux MFS transporter n=1 Tax=Salidesulfovibrio onnuriiensis TaxID=2583823 RepID=UPI0011CAD267|nr:multidrug effflux MFS transporter [Salidesulfovibrio onnuriiensis]
MIEERKQAGMTLFLAFLAAIAPLSIDMYLPALPHLTGIWGVEDDVANLTLSLWFLSFSVCILAYGPLSDRFGRKPILTTGLSLFIAACALCSLAPNVEVMIAARILQGAGGAACASMVMAICRDAFAGHVRQKVFAYIGVIMAVAPMAAPSLGSLLLNHLSWEWIFRVQGVYGLLALVLVLRMKETMDPGQRADSVRFLRRYSGLLRNRQYMLPALIMNLILGAFYAHIAASPYIYMEYFGLSRQMFSNFFALNALGMMLGAFLCAKLAKRMSALRLNSLGFVGVAAGGGLILLFGNGSPLGFALPMMLISFCCGMSRPISNNIVLEQVRTDIGSASSFMTFIQFLLGAVFMAVTSVDICTRQTVIGVLGLVTGLAVLGAWLGMLRILDTSNVH